MEAGVQRLAEYRDYARNYSNVKVCLRYCNQPDIIQRIENCCVLAIAAAVDRMYTYVVQTLAQRQMCIQIQHHL